MDNLLEEWKQKDPFLLDLEGFQQFCDIRNNGNRFPIRDDALFYSVETIRQEWTDCLRESVGSAIGTCEPIESADAYWDRNRMAAQAVRATIALFTGKADDNWPQYLNPKHLKWVEAEFGFALSEEDFKKAWELWEHPYWFSANNGYYVEGWLAVADALGIGARARDVLEKTPFPHADKPKSRDTICSKKDVCPIHQYREYLKITPIDVPDKIWRHPSFQSHVNYYLNCCPASHKRPKKEVLEIINSPDTDYRVKWQIHRMIKDFNNLPECRVCGELADFHWKITSDYHKRDMEKVKGLELCWNCMKKIHKAYEIKVMPLRFQNASGDSFGRMPEEVEMELRRKIIIGDEMFADITIEDEPPEIQRRR